MKKRIHIAQPRLAEYLFSLVEHDQGYAFISDGCDNFSRRQILAMAHRSLRHSKAVVKSLEKFLLEADMDNHFMEDQ